MREDPEARKQLMASLDVFLRRDRELFELPLKEGAPPPREEG